MGELGLTGVDTPEEYGGSNLDKITACEGVSWGGSLLLDAPLVFKQASEA